MTKRTKLYCIPYAGGSANMYNSWASDLADHIELCPIELAGRGHRMTEPKYENLEEAVNDIFNQIVNDISENDYAIFGHSLGALLSYEVTQKIKDAGLKPPSNIFFSGRKPPHSPVREKWSTLNPADFESKILSLGGTPPEFFKYPELKQIFIPLLRSDFSLSETVIDRPEIIPLDSDVTVFIGENEGISYDIAQGWHDYTVKQCEVKYLPGDHFFILNQKEAILDIINKKVSSSKFQLTL